MSEKISGKISVIIPTYNRKDFLIEAVDSLSAQTYKNLEIIIVDDGSTNPAPLPVEKYIWQSHGGISKARNTGLNLVQGEYYYMFCDDDKLAPNALEKMVGAIEGYDAVFSDLEFFGAQKGEFKAYRQNFAECLAQKKIPGAGLYRTSTVGHFRYDESFDSAVDYDYILNILKNYQEIKINILSEPLYKYRIHPGQERGSAREREAAEKIRQKYAKKI